MTEVQEQLNKILESPFFSATDRGEWQTLFPQLNGEDQVLLVQTLQQQREAYEQFAEGVRARMADSAQLQQRILTIEEFVDLADGELNTKDVVDGATALFRELIDPGEIGMFIEKLEGVVNRRDVDTLLLAEHCMAYDGLLTRAYWRRITLFTPAELDTLLRTRFVRSVRTSIPVVTELEERLTFFRDRERGGEERKKILRAIRENEERIGTQGLVFGNDATPRQPILQQWLTEYDLSVTTGNERSELERIAYFQRSKNVARLDANEKKVYLMVLEAYDALSFPKPRKVERMATPVQPQRAPRAVAPPVVAALNTQSRSMQQDRQKILNLIPVLEQERQQKNVTWQAFVKQEMATEKNMNRDRVLATLTALAQTGTLPTLVESDVTVQGLVAALQNILEGRLKMDRALAAQWGAWWARLLQQQGKTQYQNMAYYDVRSRTFQWME